MKMSWQTETDRLVCRWSEVGERVQYNPRWIQDASRNVPGKNVSPSVVVFTRLSSFGGREWYAADRARQLHPSIRSTAITGIRKQADQSAPQAALAEAALI